MMKFDKYVAYIWLIILPWIFSLFILFVGLYDFDFLELDMTYEQITMLLNIMCLIAFVYLTGWLVNLTWSGINAIKERIHSKEELE